MQAIGLTLNDGFLLQFDVDIDSADVIDYIEDLTWNWHSYAYSPIMSFDDYYGVELAKIIGPSGFCYTFNIKDASEMFHLEE